MSLCWQISSCHWHWVDRVYQSIVARVDYFTLCWQRHIILLTKLIFDHDKKWWSIVDIHDWDYTETRVHLPAEDMSIGNCSSRQYPRQSGSSINYLPSILNWVPWRHQLFFQENVSLVKFHPLHQETLPLSKQKEAIGKISTYIHVGNTAADCTCGCSSRRRSRSTPRRRFWSCCSQSDTSPHLWTRWQR